MNSLHQFLASLNGAGLKMQTIYDVGACEGQWSKEVRDNALKDSEFILFEANPAFDPLLRTSGFRYFIKVLSNPGREYVEFYKNDNTGDSYYKENTKYYDNRNSVRLDCMTLETLVGEHKLPLPDLIKLDTQGSELDVLAGASSFIDEVSLIYTECPILRYNAGAPNIQDYLDYFRDRRFVPVRLLEAHYIENTLLQIDIMFMHQSVKEKFLGLNDNIRPFA